ncbi:hypothetical protein ABPG73_013593 [Tetrahymena malaccensis]
MKTLNNLSQVSIHTNSKIKEVNYLILESSQSLYIVVQTESDEFKYFKFFTTSQTLIQQKQMVIYPLLYPIIYDLNLNSTSSTALENDQQKDFIYILESHAQVEQANVQRNSVSVMKYSKNYQRIEQFCTITIQFGLEELGVKCKETSYLNSEQNKFEIDWNEQYFFQKIDSQNHIFFYNKSEIITFHNSERINHSSLQDYFNTTSNQITPINLEQFKNFTFWKMSQISSQQLVFIYSEITNEHKQFQLIIYNTLSKKVTKIEKMDKLKVWELQNLESYVSIDILFYNKKIIFQTKYDLVEVTINDLSQIQMVQHFTMSQTFEGFSKNARFLELSYIHEGQIIPFAISKSQYSNSTYNLFIQNCMNLSQNQNGVEKESYFSNEFSCRKLTCSSFLQFQSKYSLSQQVCLFLDVQKEKKQTSNSFVKQSAFIILGVVIGIIGMKKIVKYIKIVINKIRQYRAGNNIETANLLKQDISEREKDGENNKMREEVEMISQNNEVVIQSPNIINFNNNELKPLNQQMSDLKSQSSGSSLGIQKQGSSNNDNNQGQTPTPQDGQIINNLNQQRGDLKDSYYNQSQLYYQQLQKEEKIKQLKLLQEQQRQLILEKKNKTQYIQQSKSVQHIPIDQVYNPQFLPQYGYQGNNMAPQQNQIFNQFYNQNMPPQVYYPQNKAISGEQQYLVNQNLSNQNFNNQNQNIHQDEVTKEQPILNGQFEVGQSVYIPQQKQNQQINNMPPFNRFSNDPNNNNTNNNNMILNNFNQVNLIQNQQERLNNYQQFNNQNNQNLKNTHLNITQQLKFFQWALDQQFGFNQLNQEPVPHIIGDSLIQKSQNNVSNSNQNQQSQSIPDQQQLQQSLSSFQQFLSMELGDSSQVNNKPFILSHSQIEKLTQTLHQQYEVYKNSGINNLQKKEESEIFQMFIKNELKSDLVFDQVNEQFQQQGEQVQDYLKSTAATNAVSNNSIQYSYNQDNQYQQQFIQEEQKQSNEESQNKKYKNINLGGFQKQKSVEILEDSEDINALNKMDSDNPQDNLNKNNQNSSNQNVQNKEDVRLCQICYQHEKDYAYKCGHRYCQTCALEVKKKFGKCSFCNFEIDDVIKLYD